MKAVVGVNWIPLATLAAEVLTLGFMFTVFTDRKLPLISGERLSFVILWVVGFAACFLGTLGNVREPAEAVTTTAPKGLDLSVLGWTLNPLMALGGLAMVLLPATLLGVRLPAIGGISGNSALLAAIIVVKWGLAHLHFLR